MIHAQKDEADVDQQKISEVRSTLEDILNNSNGAMDTDNVSETADSGTTESTSGWKINFRPYPEILRTGNDPVRMLRALAELGKLEVDCDTEKLPSFADLVPEDCCLSWNMTLHGDAPKDSITEVFEWIEDECDLDISPLGEANTQTTETTISTTTTESAAENTAVEKTPVATASTNKPATEKKQASKRATSGGEATSIRVGIDKVDEIINLVGELVITQSMLGQLGEDFENAQETSGAKLEKLREGLGQLERNTRELQESVMRIRMLPISFVFSRVPRLVHDLSSKLNKKVELVVEGEQTELDKTVMEKIGDPMVHLVRNALDHGIETPDVRLAAGKSETGTLKLNAFHQGGNIVIEIKDDGGGLNRDKILAKAVERGLIQDGESIADERIYDLIFHPGFSTADEVSDVSGRGVGMDVVRKNIKALGGNVDVTSTPGEGSTFTIRLPLTLAILDGQLVKVADETYIGPLISIIESLQVKPELVNAVAGKAELYRLRDEYIPIIRAHRVFGLTGDCEDLAGQLMVVVEGDGQRAGIIVDDLLAQQQVVIKSLETNFRRVDGVSGATILGDGTVALIVDIPGLINMFRDGSPSSPVKPGINEQAA
jgi:two-component system chemotaxis sensor kinase CheA